MEVGQREVLAAHQSAGDIRVNTDNHTPTFTSKGEAIKNCVLPLDADILEASEGNPQTECSPASVICNTPQQHMPQSTSSSCKRHTIRVLGVSMSEPIIPPSTGQERHNPDGHSSLTSFRQTHPTTKSTLSSASTREHSLGGPMASSEECNTRCDLLRRERNDSILFSALTPATGGHPAHLPITANGKTTGDGDHPACEMEKQAEDISCGGISATDKQVEQCSMMDVDYNACNETATARCAADSMLGDGCKGDELAMPSLSKDPEPLCNSSDEQLAVTHSCMRRMLGAAFDFSHIPAIQTAIGLCFSTQHGDNSPLREACDTLQEMVTEKDLGRGFERLRQFVQETEASAGKQSREAWCDRYVQAMRALIALFQANPRQVMYSAKDLLALVVEHELVHTALLQWCLNVTPANADAVVKAVLNPSFSTPHTLPAAPPSSDKGAKGSTRGVEGDPKSCTFNQRRLAVATPVKSRLKSATTVPNKSRGRDSTPVPLGGGSTLRSSLQVPSRHAPVVCRGGAEFSVCQVASLEGVATTKRRSGSKGPGGSVEGAPRYRASGNACSTPRRNDSSPSTPLRQSQRGWRQMSVDGSTATVSVKSSQDPIENSGTPGYPDVGLRVPSSASGGAVFYHCGPVGAQRQTATPLRLDRRPSTIRSNSAHELGTPSRLPLHRVDNSLYSCARVQPAARDTAGAFPLRASLDTRTRSVLDLDRSGTDGVNSPRRAAYTGVHMQSGLSVDSASTDACAVMREVPDYISCSGWRGGVRHRSMSQVTTNH